MKRRSSKYQTIHRRVARIRGSASSHKCIGCGMQASQWALNHSGETFQDENGKWVSERVWDYDPMCASCHRQRDLAEQPGYPSLKEKFQTDSGFVEAHRQRQRETGRRVAERIQGDPEIAEEYRVRGRAVAEISNTRRRQCNDCGRVMSAGSMGLHQKSSGHSGWVELEEK